MTFPRPLRSLRNRLTLSFAAIVAGAIGFVYLFVVPTLEEQLVQQKLKTLAEDATLSSARLGGIIEPTTEREVLTAQVRQAAERSSAEVTVFVRSTSAPKVFLPVADFPPGGVTAADVRSVAQRAAQSGRQVSDTARTPVGRQALAAEPLMRNKQVQGVAVYADALTDVQSNVALIRRRILVSGTLALIIAAVAGYLVARALTARVKRLEQAARKVAAGDFSNPIHAESDDELGRLTQAFDDMQRQLARLDTARKQFIASASHELRTPIFSLSGFLELLEDEDLDEETRAQFLAQLRGQVERMRKLATELLDLSRLESGALVLRPEPTEIGQLAREVAVEFTPAATQHEAAVEVQTGAEPIEIECDAERVAQVVRILLDNALVHTPAGTRIVVSAARENGHVALAVADAGTGIRAQNMPHIFEPFFTSGDAARGAGLGLAIARELAERMHGDLTVASTPGSTTFKLRIPA